MAEDSANTAAKKPEVWGCRRGGLDSSEDHEAVVLDGRGLEASEDFDLSKEKLPPSSLKSEKAVSDDVVGKTSCFLG